MFILLMYNISKIIIASSHLFPVGNYLSKMFLFTEQTCLKVCNIIILSIRPSFRFLY